LGKALADFKDFVIIFFVGLVVGYILKGGQASSVKTYSNEEVWEFIRDDRGRTLGVKVHRSAEEN
jgi:hypothetical protein